MTDEATPRSIPRTDAQTAYTKAAARAVLERAAGCLLPRQFDMDAAITEYRAALTCRLPLGFTLDDAGRLHAPADATPADVSDAVATLGDTYARLEAARVLAAHRFRRRWM